VLSARRAGCRHLLAITNRRDITIVAASRCVVIGADTHRDTNHLAVIADAGKPSADAEFPTSPAGYDDALRWARSFGTVAIAGVEGTSSYGAGLTPVLQAAGIEVAKACRSDRAARRRQGKSDPIDAYAAARAALAGHGLAVPNDAHASALQALLGARSSAVKAHTAATNQIHALLVTAPAELRERYRRYSTAALVKALARCRPATHSDPTTVAVLTACKALAQRTEFLERQKQDLTAQLDVLVSQINPALRAAYGVGPDTAAQLLATAGTNRTGSATRPRWPRCPEWLPSRHPLAKSRATDSPAAATGQPTMPCTASRWCACRPTSRPATTSNVNTHGRTKKEILRLLKRAIAREIFRLLTRPAPIDDYCDLRPARQAKSVTLATVATHFGVPLITVSRLERGHQRNDTLATTTANGSSPLDLLTGIGASTSCECRELTEDALT
jgi:transposase